MNSVIWKGENIVKKYGENGFSLKDVSLAIAAGEITGVVGENGNGKTTLLRVMAGELDANSGTIVAFGKQITPENWRTFKENVSYIPQRIPRWYGSLRTNLEFQASSHGLPSHEIESYLQVLLQDLGLEKYADLQWSEISTGYRLRFQLAKMLITNPKLIILDEPIANLDINAQEKFLSDLKNIVSNDVFETAVILSSQQLHQVEAISDNIVFIKNGSIEYSGKVNDVGLKRVSNSFEISGNFNENELSKLLGKNGHITSSNGNMLQLDTELEFRSSNLLNEILNAGFEIKYYRDISSSTKKLFGQSK